MIVYCCNGLMYMHSYAGYILYILYKNPPVVFFKLLACFVIFGHSVMSQLAVNIAPAEVGNQGMVSLRYLRCQLSHDSNPIIELIHQVCHRSSRLLANSLCNYRASKWERHTYIYIYIDALRCSPIFVLNSIQLNNLYYPRKKGTLDFHSRVILIPSRATGNQDLCLRQAPALVLGVGLSQGATFSEELWGLNGCTKLIDVHIYSLHIHTVNIYTYIIMVYDLHDLDIPWYINKIWVRLMELLWICMDFIAKQTHWQRPKAQLEKPWSSFKISWAWCRELNGSNIHDELFQ